MMADRTPTITPTGTIGTHKPKRKEKDKINFKFKD
jgi:hypothetical protein